MRIVLIVILIATGLFLWWSSEGAVDPARKEAKRTRIEPEKAAGAPSAAQPKETQPIETHPIETLARADVADLRRQLSDAEGYPLGTIEELTKLGPAAADAIPELAARLVAFARHKEEYEAANRMTHVNWIRVDFRVGEALTAIGEASIPALIELIGSEYDDARWSARRSLEELAPKSIPALIDAARDPNALRREEAATALAVAAKTHPEIFGTLQGLIDDPERDVRRAALKSLGAFGARSAPLLIEKLGGDDVMIAADVFSDHPAAARAAVPAIAAQLGHKYESVRWDLAKALERTGKDAAPAVDALAARLGEKHKYAGESIVRALANVGEPAIGVLQTAMGSPDPVIRARAIEALSRIDGAGEAMIPAYHRMLSSDSKGERHTAAIALARQGAHAPDALPVLEEILRGEDYRRSKDVLLAVRKYASEPAPVIAMLFRFVAFEGPRSESARYSDFRRGDMHKEIPKTLAALGTGNPGLVAAGLHHDSRNTRERAYFALVELKQKSGPAAIAECGAELPIARALALKLLPTAAKDDPRAAAAIDKALVDKDWRVRAAAAGSLWFMRKDAQRSLPVLIEAVGHMPANTGDYYAAREFEQFGWTLRSFGKAAEFALADLQALAKEAPNQNVRWNAEQAVKAFLAPEK